MTFRTVISFVALVTIVFISAISGTGCANIVPPAGGPRDSIPPLLVKATPVDSTRNFDGSRIAFTFDEYVDLENFQQNAIISPIPKLIPNASHRLNTITIRLKDTLEPNTTYSINFGNSIKDYNEGNVMKDFTYVFSTGPTIDSLTLRGNVILAETGALDTTLIVMLHKNSYDSAIVKERPRYIAKLDSKGNFEFRNLPAGTFYLYALKDDTRSYRYQAKALFAFADSPVVIRQNTPDVKLFAYEAMKASRTAPATNESGATNKRLKFQTSAAGGKQDLLHPFSFEFERPLRRFDSAKVHFFSDTTFTPVTGYSWSIDSTKKKVTLSYTWKENTLYHLIVDKDFAEDTLRRQLFKTDTISFNTLGRSDYGKVSIRLRNLDLSKKPVLQFVQAGDVVNSFTLTSDNFTQDLFLPGEYELRILQDDNKNGIWDPGEFFGKHKQPELVKPIERKINIRPNFENEIEIVL